MYAFRDSYQRNKKSIITNLWSLCTIYIFTGGVLRAILVIVVGREVSHKLFPIFLVPGFDGIYRSTLKVATAIMLAGVVAVFSENPYYRIFRTTFSIMICWLSITSLAHMYYLVEDITTYGPRAIPHTLFSDATEWLLMLPAAIIAYYLSRYESANHYQQD